MTTAENGSIQILTERQFKNFWEKVDKSPHPKGCWVWTASMCCKGYGFFGFGGHMWRAHRISYRMHNGAIPPGLCVCHTCDNPPCVNPAHLFIGTHRDNSDDKMSKGRNVPSKGEKNGGGQKLKWDSICEIRRIWATGDYTQTALAPIFGVSQPMIGLIVRGEKWKERGHD